MPLIHRSSKAAFKKNIEVEMKEHPENPKQNIAIAYNIQRKAKKKKMAKGGMAKHEHDNNCYFEGGICSQERSEQDGAPESKFADGGMVGDHEEARPHSLAEAIMRKRKAQMYADGGMVDLDENSEEHPNGYDQMNMEAAKKEQYDDEQLSAQPENSNESGDMREENSENKHDRIAAIQRRMKAKRS